MSLETFMGLSIADLATIQGLPVADLETIMGLGPLPSEEAVPPADIPAPTYYWPFTADRVDTVHGYEIPVYEGAVRFVPGGVIGDRISNDMGAYAYLMGSIPGATGSRFVVAAVLAMANVAANNAAAISASSQFQLVTGELAGAAGDVLIEVFLGNELGTISGYASEFALWIDPPEYWTAESALAFLGQGDGVVWRNGQWVEVVAV